MNTTPTPAQLLALRAAACRDDDATLVRLIDRARTGDARALDRCAEILADRRALTLEISS